MRPYTVTIRVMWTEALPWLLMLSVEAESAPEACDKAIRAVRLNIPMAADFEITEAA